MERAGWADVGWVRSCRTLKAYIPASSCAPIQHQFKTILRSLKQTGRSWLRVLTKGRPPPLAAPPRIHVSCSGHLGLLWSLLNLKKTLRGGCVKAVPDFPR